MASYYSKIETSIRELNPRPQDHEACALPLSNNVSAFSLEHVHFRGQRVLHLPGVVAALQHYPVLHLRRRLQLGLQRDVLPRGRGLPNFAQVCPATNS